MALASQGFQPSNPYSLQNYSTSLGGRGSGKKKSKQEETNEEIEKYSFMYRMPRSWRFKLSSNNPYQRKKVAELPDNLKKVVLGVNSELVKSRTTIQELKENSKKMDE